MSNILWGISQLVEDPSNSIVNSLRRHIFSSASDVSDTEAVSVRDVTVKKINKLQNLIPTSPSSLASGTKSQELQTHKSKSVQFGTELRSVNSRNVSTQCSMCPTKFNKTTSVAQIERNNQSVATVNVGKKHAFTKPLDLRGNMCEDHRHVIKLLRKWPVTEKKQAAVRSTPDILTILKSYMVDTFKMFKVEKVQSLPQYHINAKHIMKLYKKASVEETRSPRQRNMHIKLCDTITN